MKLKEAFEKKKFVVTSEIHSPINESPETIIKSLELIRGRVDGISVPEIDFEGIVGDRISTCAILKQNRFEPIYQTTTRDKHRNQLEKDLLLAYESGVENLLVFTEDYRLTGDSLQEMMFFHVDVGKLNSVLDCIRNGHTIENRALPFKAEFLLGSGVDSSWGKNIPELEMKEMEEMLKVGTGYFLATPVFDLKVFEKFVRQVNPFGIPIIAEIIILRTASMAQFLNRHFKPGLVPEWIISKLATAKEKQKASIEIFAEIVSGLKELCHGVHIITVGGEENLRYYLDAAKLI